MKLILPKNDSLYLVFFSAWDGNIVKWFDTRKEAREWIKLNKYRYKTKLVKYTKDY